MSTGLIIAIVVIAIILVALLVFLPRMREKARVQKRERELGHRREAVAGEHREVADTREREAEQAEREARMAEKNAERQRAEAQLHQERASMHEQGQADHELIDENERDRFKGTSADSTGTGDAERSEFDQGREAGHEEERSGRFGRDEESSDTPSPGSHRA